LHSVLKDKCKECRHTPNERGADLPHLSLERPVTFPSVGHHYPVTYYKAIYKCSVYFTSLHHVYTMVGGARECSSEPNQPRPGSATFPASSSTVQAQYASFVRPSHLHQNQSLLCRWRRYSEDYDGFSFQFRRVIRGRTASSLPPPLQTRLTSDDPTRTTVTNELTEMRTTTTECANS